MPKKSKNTRKRLIDLNNYNLSTESVEEKPALEVRSLLVRKAETIQYLNGTTMPQQFRFREKQIEKIEGFLQACLKKEKKGYRFMMITGSPGAGKTLSVNSVMSKMKCEVIRMNANVVKNVAEVQSLICMKLLGDSNPRTTSQILRQLEEIKYKQCCVVYIQQIEVLFKTAPDIVSQDFLSLFLKKSLNLILLGISNTIDTLQKYSGKYSFKVTEIQNVVFPPYSGDQIMAILSDKLKYVMQHFNIKVDFSDKLLRFAAQKLQTLKKGDFRICGQFLKQTVKRSFASVTNQEEAYTVTITTINEVFNKMHISKNELMSTLPYHQIIILLGLHNIIKKTDGLYVPLPELQSELKWICNSLQITHSGNLMQDRLKELQQYGMITVRRKKNFQTQILLQMGVQDIKATFHQNEMLNKFLVG